ITDRVTPGAAAQMEDRKLAGTAQGHGSPLARRGEQEQDRGHPESQGCESSPSRVRNMRHRHGLPQHIFLPCSGTPQRLAILLFARGYAPATDRSTAGSPAGSPAGRRWAPVSRPGALYSASNPMATPATAPLLEVRGISKRFGG